MVERQLKMIAASACLVWVKGQNGLKYPFSAKAALALLLLPVLAAAQTAPLNDTGQTACYDASNAVVACTASPLPGQDARFGRDAAQAAGVLTKTGGGAAGFDFTALDASGNATTTLGSHACVKDNVTGLTWEVKQAGANTQLRYTGHTYTWYDSAAANPGSPGGSTCNGTLPGNQCNTQAYVAAVNAGAGLCGKTDWRLPTRRELLSIVHYGTSSPAIDPAYFPDTQSNWYWTSTTYAPDPAGAWNVYFNDGGAYAYYKAYSGSVRLVRSGQ
jgi:hypothetical protein